MTRNSSHLRLVVEPVPSAPAADPLGAFGGVASLCSAFQQATGWELRYEEKGAVTGNEMWSAGVPQPDGRSARLVVDRPFVGERGSAQDAAALLAFENVRPLAVAVGTLLGELAKTRHALWQREAELAAGVPVAAKPDEEHLAVRLESVLKGGVEAVNADAAGLYLLDDATTSLKLRAMHNLPRGRFLDPPRMLRGSVADLEALVGHAVVLEDTALLPQWKCPENFPSAVCVPISTPTTPLGTLWVYSKSPREFTPEQTNLLEIVAGRIGADLEREVLLTAGMDAKQMDRSAADTSRWFHERMPQNAPLVDDWDIAGWCHESAPAGEFYDWTVLPDGRIAFALASVAEGQSAVALHAAALQAAWRSHAPYNPSSAALLGRLNETLWTASTGELGSAFFTGALNPAEGMLDCAAAGDVTAVHIHGDGRRVIPSEPIALGIDPDRKFRGRSLTLNVGDMLLLLSRGACSICDEAGLRIGEASLVKLILKHQHRPADQLSRVLQEMLMLRIGDKRIPAAFLLMKRER